MRSSMGMLIIPAFYHSHALYLHMSRRPNRREKQKDSRVFQSENAKAIGREAPAGLECGKQAKRIATWYHASGDTGKRMAHALPDDQLCATDDEEPAMPHYPQMYPARQLLYSAPIADIPATVDAELRRARSEERRVGKECRSRWSP